MSMEWEGEVKIEEDFSTYDLESKLQLIRQILNDEIVMFTGCVSVTIDPPDDK